MSKFKADARRGREEGDARGASEGNAERGDSPPAPADLRSRVPADFAANVQVTETERTWLRDHLGPLYEKELILDVVRRVKAGKEATVYACTGHPSTGRAIVAAKVYREYSLRSSKNTGLYQQGRALLDEDGNSPKKRSGRPDKVVSQKSKRGREANQTSWLMHEFTLLEAMHERGGDVPEPIEHAEHTLLMEYIGDGLDAAPTLNDVDLEPDEAKRLFDRVLFNIELLLELGWVHGDLSAHNILYHQGRIILIDFPQVVDCQNNAKARAIFDRDVERVCQYFDSAASGIEPKRLARDLWQKHVGEPEVE